MGKGGTVGLAAVTDDQPGADRVKVLGVHLNPITLDRAAAGVLQMAAQPEPQMVVTANAELVMMAREDPELAGILREADMVVADGIGLVWAAALLGAPVPERVAGVDLVAEVMAEAAREQRRVYFLGAAPGVAQQAAHVAVERFPGLVISGTHHGYFSEQETPQVLADIRTAAPHILLAALGAPRQEKWLWRHRSELQVPVAMGVGGSLDILAGTVPRAPGWMQRLGLEWLFRLLRQPWRIRRMLVLPRFVLHALQAKWHGRGKR